MIGLGEKALWRLLRNGALQALNWRKQAPFRHYTLDFVSHPARLVVEADGAHHADPAQRRHDEIRTALLASEGYQVLRFWNRDIFGNADGVYRAIYAAALKSPARARMQRWQAAHPTSPSMGEVAELREAGGGVALTAQEKRRLAPSRVLRPGVEGVTPPGRFAATLPIEGRVE